MLFSALSMGAEDYYLCTSVFGGSGISLEDISTVNGRRIGVNKDSFQEQKLREWLDANGIQAEVVELMTDEAASVELLNRGELDAYVSLDSYGSVHNLFPLWKVGSSDFYFALKKDRHDLLGELNSAMSRIMDENRYYNQKLQEKYLDAMMISGFLTENELKWLSNYETIRVGYRDDFLPFCDRDNETGELTGALRDFLDFASRAMQNGELKFETTAYPTILDALEGLKNGEVDCVFPVNMTAYDAEQSGVLVTSSQMQTEIYASVPAAVQKDLSLNDGLTAAIREGDYNYTTFLMDYFPNWSYEVYPDKTACCQAVAEGRADCLLTSNYRLNLNADLFEQYNLSTVSTGKVMRFAFAARRQDDYLCTILNKITSYEQDSVMASALASYSYIERQFTVMDFLRAHFIAVLILLSAVVVVILTLLVRSVRAERKSRQAEQQAKDALRALQESLGREEVQKRELNVTKHKAYTDPLTGVKSKQAYLEDVSALKGRMDTGEDVEFAVVVFDVNDLKKVNDLQGHEAGDQHIKNASRLICELFKHSPVYRIGGDEFASILGKKDYFNREMLLKAFDAMVDENKRCGRVVVSAGSADYDPKKDESYSDVFQRADEAMYERKKFLKGGRDIR